jgi:hypothetical protein
MITPRIRLKKKRSTEDQIINEIHSLLYGTGSRPYPLTVTETAKVLGVSRDTIYRYVKLMNGEKKILKTKDRLVLPELPEDSRFKQFNKAHPITGDPLVTEWIDDLLTRKGGSPLKNWSRRICCLETVCNTCRIEPQDLIVSHRRTEKIMRTFAKFYTSGNSAQSKCGPKPTGLNSGVYTRVQAVRDFCMFYNLFWHKGVTGIMSQKVLGHGKYGDIRLTEDELYRADIFIKEKWGLDSDIYRWFWVGVESCARFEALYNMPLEYTKSVSAKSGKTTYIMSVIETKTDQIRGGKWSKYISRKDTQASLDLLKSRNGARIHENDIPKYKFTENISSSLREIYKHLGKHSSYFQGHPTHALRHIGAHYWLSKTDYNYGLIAEIGGWNTMDELKKSYGQIPPEKILEIIQ